jgi:hypothetical protein
MGIINDHLRDRLPEPSRESPAAPAAHAAHVDDLPVPVPASAKVEATTLVVLTRQAVEVLPPELAEMTDSAQIAVGLNEVDNSIPVKRGRGRPRKHPRALLDGSQEATLTESPTSAGPASKGSGRPLRSPAPMDRMAAHSGPSSSADAAPCHGPGRPRGNPVSPEVVSVADDHPLIAKASGGEELPMGIVEAVVRADDPLRAPRVRGPKMPRWQIAGKLRRGRLK